MTDMRITRFQLRSHEERPRPSSVLAVADVQLASGRAVRGVLLVQSSQVGKHWVVFPRAVEHPDEAESERILTALSAAYASDRTRRGFANAAGMTFGLLRSEVLPVEGGWREARILDEGFAGWLCLHVHASAQEAHQCRDERESVLSYPGRFPDPEGDRIYEAWKKAQGQG